MSTIAICLLAVVYHESCRPSVAAGTTLAAATGQAKPFTEFPQLREEARFGRMLTAKRLLGRFNFDAVGDRDVQLPLVDSLAAEICECEREAIENGWVVVKLDPPRPWVPFAELPAPAQEGRRSQARYLLERFHITYRDRAVEASDPAYDDATFTRVREALAAAGFVDPPVALWRARVALEFMKQALALIRIVVPNPHTRPGINFAMLDQAVRVAGSLYDELLVEALRLAKRADALSSENILRAPVALVDTSAPASARVTAREAASTSAQSTGDAELFAREQLREDGFADPSIALLRARLMLDHAREARDLGHGWPDMLQLTSSALRDLDKAEAAAAHSYRTLAQIEQAGGDRIAGTSTPAQLTKLLRQAQAHRDEVVAENLKLESRLTLAEIAISSAQQENRAPTWPPAESTGHGQSVEAPAQGASE